MLNLDGARQDIETREIGYVLPAPFGPNREEAFIKFVAKPASAQNPEYKSALERLLATAKQKDIVRQKAYERTDDLDKFIQSGDEDVKAMNKAVLMLNYDHCIVSWSTNIQNDGADLEATRENYSKLAEFPHPEVSKIFTRLKTDLADFAKWQAEAMAENEEAEKGNSKRSSKAT